jgi:hypothetical protein
MFGALIRAADRWRGLRFTEFELRQIAAVSRELDQEYIVPPISTGDELTTVETRFGPMEKWKARALAIGWFQRVADSVRQDDAAAHDNNPETTATGPAENEPPPVVADEDEDKETAARLDSEWLARV